MKRLFKKLCFITRNSFGTENGTTFFIHFDQVEQLHSLGRKEREVDPEMVDKAFRYLFNNVTQMEWIVMYSDEMSISANRKILDHEN